MYSTGVCKVKRTLSKGTELKLCQAKCSRTGLKKEIHRQLSQSIMNVYSAWPFDQLLTTVGVKYNYMYFKNNIMSLVDKAMFH